MAPIRTVSSRRHRDFSNEGPQYLHIVFNIKSTEDLKSKHKNRIRLLFFFFVGGGRGGGGLNTKPIRGSEERIFSIKNLKRATRFRFLIAKISLPSF